MFVYLIFSAKLNRFYIGETEDIEIRLRQHVTKFFPGAFTKLSSDWDLKLVLKVSNRIESRQVERYIKGMKSKTFNQKIISDECFRMNFIKRVYDKFMIVVSEVEIN
jgi:putative endonuclease